MNKIDLKHIGDQLEDTKYSGRAIHKLAPNVDIKELILQLNELDYHVCKKCNHWYKHHCYECDYHENEGYI